jgi:transcription elongation GreA/GreB family factor
MRNSARPIRVSVIMKPLDKQALFEELLAQLQRERDKALAAQQATAEGATHSESKADSDKDTRATEASYLARGQAERAEALSRDVQRLARMKLRSFEPESPVALSALVTIESEEGTARRVFVAAAGGGLVLAEGSVSVVTPQSPLGRVLIGATEGDSVELVRAGRTSSLEIVCVD